MDSAKADLIRALGGLVRGLATLFWGIPLTLAVDMETARTDWLESLGAASFAPALVLSAALCYGLRQMRDFQKQERVWQQALHRAELFAVVNAGLAPFLFWWHRFPSQPLYFVCVNALAASGYIFLFVLNRMLRRLAAMLPDEMLRTETRVFVTWNSWMLTAAVAALSLYLALSDSPNAPRLLGRRLTDFQSVGEWLILFLTLTPIAVTLTLLWKIKEAIFTGMFEVER
jgi:multisubunit Na+/H+ antiporter MnhB subunit